VGCLLRLFVLGTVAIYSGRYAEAVDFCTTSVNLHRDAGAEPITARDLGGLGTGLLNLGDTARARLVLDESLAVARRYEDRWGTAMSLMLLGHTDLAEGDVAHAQAVLAEAGSLFQATGNMVYFRGASRASPAWPPLTVTSSGPPSWPEPATRCASRSA
jgi:Tetratricopeptide repeat